MKQHYDYGIINGDTVRLFNDSIIDIHPLHDVVLEDVNVELCDNGVLKIDAKEIQYDFYFRSNGRRIFEEDWQRTPHPKCIKEGKRHFWSKNKERYVNFGWVRTTETTPMQYFLSKYKVEIYYYGETLRRFNNQRIEPQRIISAEAKEAMYNKSADKVEPKFKVGDKIMRSSKSSCPVHDSTDDTICKVAEIHDICYILDTKEGKVQEPFIWQDYYKLVVQNPAWSKEDKKLTDVNHEYFSELLENANSDNIDDYAYQVAYCMSHDWANETPTWDDVRKACKLGVEWNEKHHKSAWSEEDETSIAINNPDAYRIGFADGEAHAKEEMTTAWSEEDEKTIYNIDAAIRHEVVFPIDELKSMEIWLESLKYRICPKHEWKRDEKMFQLIEDVIDVYRKTQGSVIGGIHTEELKYFLNCMSLRQDWKPSDEQMASITCAVRKMKESACYDSELVSLLDDLKKLREE